MREECTLGVHSVFNLTSFGPLHGPSFGLPGCGCPFGTSIKIKTYVHGTRPTPEGWWPGLTWHDTTTITLQHVRACVNTSTPPQPLPTCRQGAAAILTSISREVGLNVRLFLAKKNVMCSCVLPIPYPLPNMHLKPSHTHFTYKYSWTCIDWYCTRSSLLDNSFNYNTFFICWWSYIYAVWLCVQVIWGSKFQQILR